MKKWIIILFIVGMVSLLYAQPGPIQPILTNLTQFVNQTAWRVFYSDTNGDVTELALGANGTFLQSNGAAAAPTWEAAAGGGDITSVWDTASGAVTTPKIGTGEFLDGGTATTDAAGEGILLPRSNDVSAATAEGQISWDADNDLLYVGDGVAVVSIAGAFDSTAVDATTWSDGSNASNQWTFDVSGTDHTMVFGNGIVTFSHAVTVSGPVILGDGGDNFSVASDGIDIATNGNITNAGTIGSGAITSTAAVGGTDLTASDDIIGQDDLQLDSDAALIQLGEDQDVVLTHVADTGILLTGGTDEQLQFGDSGTFINQGTDGTLDLEGDTLIEATAPNIRLMFDAAAYLNIATADGGITTISQVSDGTDEIKIGDDSDLVSVSSGNWDVSNAGVFSGLTGLTSTGDINFGGADLEIPQGQTPDTDGDIDADFTDGTLVIQHGAAHAELAGSTDVVIGKLIRSFSATIFAPDGVNDVIPLKPIISGEFPHGIVVTEVHMVVGTDTNYTIDVENWDDFDTQNVGDPSINSTAYTAGNDGEVTDSAITFPGIAAGQIIMLDIPATDIDWVNITVFYYEPIA